MALNAASPRTAALLHTHKSWPVMLWVWVLCTRPHYFYCPSPDFTTSSVSQSVTNNRCPPSCGGTREKWGGTSKKFLLNARVHYGDSFSVCEAHNIVTYSQNVFIVYTPVLKFCMQYNIRREKKWFIEYYLGIGSWPGVWTIAVTALC